MLRLHMHPLSAYARRVRIALREKGLACEERTVDGPGFTTRDPAFLRLNPFGRVPTLEHDGVVVWESSAVLEYLEERFPTPALLPADAAGRARVRGFMKAADCYLVPPLMDRYVRPRLQLPRERWNRAEQEAALAEVAAHLDVLERTLDGRAYLAGTYSLADVTYAPFVVGLESARGGSLVASRPAVGAWIERLAARPAVRATAVEGAT